MTSQLSIDLCDLNDDAVITAVKQRQAEGVPALNILAELQSGMEMVGKRYEANEYFLSELIMAAHIFKGATDFLGEEFVQGGRKTIGTIVLGTAVGDLHDIGKDVVAMVLGCNGIKVIDLGVNVPIQRFVEAVREHQPELVGLSCLMTTAFDGMRATVEALEAAGLRDKVKVLVGGGPVDAGACQYAKADAYGKSAQEAVAISKKLLEVK